MWIRGQNIAFYITQKKFYEENFFIVQEFFKMNKKNIFKKLYLISLLQISFVFMI